MKGFTPLFAVPMITPDKPVSVSAPKTETTCKGIGIMGGKKGKRLCGETVNRLSVRWKDVTCPVCLSKKKQYQYEASLSKAAIRSIDDDFPFDEEEAFLDQMNYRR